MTKPLFNKHSLFGLGVALSHLVQQPKEDEPMVINGMCTQCGYPVTDDMHKAVCVTSSVPSNT